MTNGVVVKTIEVAVGVCASGLGLTLLNAPARGYTPPAHAAASSATPSQTPRDATLQLALGDRFDDDAHLSRGASPVASYNLTATLDPVRHVVTGKGTIVWTNRARTPTDELWFHLYLNAFKNDRTLFLRSPFGAGRSGSKASDWGYVDVKRLVARELGNVDLWPNASRHSPGDPDDQTDIRVPLPQQIAPDAAVTLEIEFESKLPSIVERTGFAGGYHFVAQWFPKLARRDPDGTWAHFPFHPQSEFYADYGNYDVTIDVPEAMLVGASGQRTSERVSAGRRVVRQRVENVHDFAWTAWDKFERSQHRIDGITIELLRPPGHDRNAAVTLEALSFALPHFNRKYGRYPYPVLTVVHPPDAGRNSGGMEYPTLITTGGEWYLGYSGVRALETVTIHELGHQWFYGLLATDERLWPFLDEGLNTYAEGIALSERYGSGSLVHWPGFTVSSEAIRRAVSAEFGRRDAVALPAARFTSFRELGALVYARTGTILSTLERVYGPAVRRGFERYARGYRFEHPGPKHFIAAIAEAAGPDAAAVLQQALFEQAWVDYRVEDLQSARITDPAGVFDRDNRRDTVTRSDGAPQRWVGRVTVRRDGTLRLPVDVELVAENGQKRRRRWDGRGTFTLMDYEGDSPLVSARVDPDLRVVLDDNLLNNGTSRVPESLPRLSERILYYGELLLTVLGP